MSCWILYNSKLGTSKQLNENEAQEVRKFYKIDFPLWDDYHQRHDYNSLRNLRGDMILCKYVEGSKQ